MLRGTNIILEEISINNLEWLRTQRNDPEIRRYFREWKDITTDKQLQWYAERGNNSNPQHVYFQIMMSKSSTDSSSKSIIGCCGLHYIDWRLGAAEFSVFLDPMLQGKGYGKEALQLMFNYGFAEAGLRKIWAEVWDNNTAIYLYRKLGFVDEGIRRQQYYHEGKFGNSFMISLLREEWEKASWNSKT